MPYLTKITGGVEIDRMQLLMLEYGQDTWPRTAMLIKSSKGPLIPKDIVATFKTKAPQLLQLKFISNTEIIQLRPQ